MVWSCATPPDEICVSQFSLHNAPIFRLLLKVAAKGTHQCESFNFCGTSVPTDLFNWWCIASLWMCVVRCWVALLSSFGSLSGCGSVVFHVSMLRIAFVFIVAWLFVVSAWSGFIVLPYVVAPGYVQPCNLMWTALDLKQLDSHTPRHRQTRLHCKDCQDVKV